MRAKGLVQAIIGAKGFVLEDITINTEMNEIYLAIRQRKHEQCWCGICRQIYQELEAARPSRFNGLVNTGIDETGYKKGHKYMTVVINHDTASVVWCGKGLVKEVLSQSFELLTEDQRASIRCVSADAGRWIDFCVEKYCLNAQRCVDPFHVVSWAIDALNQVRREA